jgi:diguanylate cyclase (GGDEF)-like protein
VIAITHWRILALLLLALACPAPAIALDPAKSITQFIHSVWQARDGLPQNTITAIAQTPDGYLWLGTREGLARFDGVRFTIYTNETTPALAQSQILSLLADREGRLWIGTWGGGLTKLERGTFSRFSAKQGLPNELVSAIAQDRQGRLWAGTDGGGLARLDGDRFAPIASQGALGKQVRAIVEAADGLWVGSEAGLAHVSPTGEIKSYTEAQGLTHRSIRSLLMSRDGVLWIGTDHGADRLVNGAFQHFAESEVLSHDLVLALEEDRNGAIWIGTDARSLKRWHNGKVDTFSSREGLSNDSVYSLFEDREGGIWVGTNLGGLNRLREGLFTPYGRPEGLSHNYMRAVFEDRQGNLWIGTEGGGVNRISNGSVTAFTTKDGLSNDTVFSIIQDRDGAMWFGTDSGLTRLKDGHLESVTRPTPYANFAILSLLEDRDGTIWLGTYANGIIRYRDGAFTTLGRKDGLSHETVNVMHQDRAGIIWIGTRGGGLNRYAPDGTLTALTRAQGLSDDLIFAIHETNDGALWLGTYGGGLTRMKGGKFAAVKRQHGLHDDVIHRIIDDGQGRYWMSTNRGIFRVSRQELDEVADGKRATLRSIVYGPGDGMRNAECNGGASSGTMTRAGRIWFPTIEGVVAIDLPKVAAAAAPPPPVIIEDVIVDDRQAAHDGTLALTPAAQTLVVNFTATSLAKPGAVRFRYRMDGLESEWVSAGTRRTAYYSKLPPGTYRFVVAASNADGEWAESGSGFAVSVAPNWYETTWFMAVVAIALATAGPLLLRVRIRRFASRQRELERTIAERTADLHTANVRLEQLAREDGLTGLLNRRAFDETLNAECRRAIRLRTPMALLLLDIDAFKAYNDRHGHQAGDSCLKAVAEALHQGHRRAGEVVARYGGEELAVIVPGVPRERLQAMADHARLAIEALAIPHGDSTAGPVVTVSVGVSGHPGGDGLSPEKLLAAADRALYDAKSAGRNQAKLADASI